MSGNWREVDTKKVGEIIDKLNAFMRDEGIDRLMLGAAMHVMIKQLEEAGFKFMAMDKGSIVVPPKKQEIH